MNAADQKGTRLKSPERLSRPFALPAIAPAWAFAVGPSRAAAKELTGKLPHVAPINQAQHNR
jgi:hypothetical protein